MVAINTTPTEVRSNPDLPEEKLTGAARSHRVDLGLSVLCALAVPGATFSRHEIAAWTGCSFQAIDKIEKKALKKLANKLAFGLPALAREISAEHDGVIPVRKSARR